MSSGSDSTTDSTYSSPESRVNDDEDDDGWDEELIDEEVLELREVLQKSRVTVSLLDESGDSLDSEDNEHIKAKLRALRNYVSDLQSSYNELLQTFRLLEDAAKERVTALESKLAMAFACAKDFQDRCIALEAQLRELKGERGRSLDSQTQIDALENDLSSLLKAITEGVESGVIKLSELQLSSHFPLQDVVVDSKNVTIFDDPRRLLDLEDEVEEEEEDEEKEEGDCKEEKHVMNYVDERRQSPLDKKRVIEDVSCDINTDEQEGYDIVITSDQSGSSPSQIPIPSDVEITNDSIDIKPQPQPRTNQVIPKSSDQLNKSPNDKVSSIQDENTNQLQEDITNIEITRTGNGVIDNDQVSPSIVVKTTDIISEEERGLSPVLSKRDDPSNISHHSDINPLITQQDIRSEVNEESPVLSEDQKDSPTSQQNNTMTKGIPVVSRGTQTVSHLTFSKALRTSDTENTMKYEIEQSDIEETLSLEETKSHLIRKPVPIPHTVREPGFENESVESNREVHEYKLKELDRSYYNDDIEEKILYKDEDLLTSQKMDQSTYSDELHVDGEDTLSQILERECRIAELETCVQDLQHQLQESVHDHESTQYSLTDALDTLRNYRLNETLKNDQEMLSVMSKVDQLETESEDLVVKVKNEKEKVKLLEDAKKMSEMEVDELKKRIQLLSDLIPQDGIDKEEKEEDLEMNQLLMKTQLTLNDSNLQSLKDETEVLLTQREDLQKQCEDVEGRVGLLQGALRSAKHEAHRLQAISAVKEAELKRLLSVIHATRAQLIVLHKTPQERSNNESLSPCEEAVEGLELDVDTLKTKWEELCVELSNHQAAIATLTGRDLTLQSELDRRAARVMELEALLQANDVINGSEMNTLDGVQTSLRVLKSDLNHTHDEYVLTNRQMDDIQQQLKSAVNSLVSQLKILQEQVSQRDDCIHQLEREKHYLQSQCQSADQRIHEEEKLKRERERQLQQVEEELLKSEEKVRDIEEQLERENELRVKDIEYERAVVLDVCHQISQVTGYIQDEVEMDHQSSDLQNKLFHRDKLLQSLQEQTSLLMEQHSNTLREVEERHHLVSQLDSNLRSTQTLCDALEQEVSDGHKKLTAVQRQLAENQREKMDLEEQLQNLQIETEDACSSLESALRKNILLKQQSQDRFDILENKLETEKAVCGRLEARVSELSDDIEDRDEQLTILQDSLTNVESENIRLQSDNKHSYNMMSKMKEEIKDSDDNSNVIRRELAGSLVMVDSFHSQLTEIESAKLTAETIAEERLHEVMALQERLHEVMALQERLLELSAHSRDEEQLLESKQKLEDNYQQQLDYLQEEVTTLKTLYETKSVELEKVKYQYQVLLEKDTLVVEQLEECRRELKICKHRATELDLQYQNSLTELSNCQTELNSVISLQSKKHTFEVKENDKHDNRMKTIHLKIVSLERELDNSKSSLREAETLMITAEEEKRKLLHKLSTLEERFITAVRTNSQQKLELSLARSKNEEQRKLCTSLQRDYDHVTEQVSQWAESNQTATDALVQKITEQDNEITSLKSQHRQLATDNNQLREELRQRIDVTTDEGSLESTLLPPLELQYQQTLEKGISSTSGLDTSGYSSPNSCDDLDKAFWIRRAGELSVQLQQSSEYWSAKVREQAFKIHKYESKR